MQDKLEELKKKYEEWSAEEIENFERWAALKKKERQVEKTLNQNNTT